MDLAFTRLIVGTSSHCRAGGNGNSKVITETVWLCPHGSLCPVMGPPSAPVSGWEPGRRSTQWGAACLGERLSCRYHFVEAT